MTDLSFSAEEVLDRVDQELCHQIGRDLTEKYPGHLWSVGCNHEAGTIAIGLPYQRAIKYRNYAFMLHIADVIGPGGNKLVMRAGGEMLERFGLRRGAAQSDVSQRAKEHGLIVDNAIGKSRH